MFCNVLQCSAMLSNDSNAQQCSAMHSNAQQCSAMLSNAQQCSAMLSNAQQCSAMLSNAQQSSQCSAKLKSCESFSILQRLFPALLDPWFFIHFRTFHSFYIIVCPHLYRLGLDIWQMKIDHFYPITYPIYLLPFSCFSSPSVLKLHTFLNFTVSSSSEYKQNYFRP